MPRGDVYAVVLDTDATLFGAARQLTVFAEALIWHRAASGSSTEPRLYSRFPVSGGSAIADLRRTRRLGPPAWMSRLCYDLRGGRLPGSPSPLGCHLLGRRVNSAFLSNNAEGVELCLFDRASGGDRALAVLPQCTGDIWHGFVADMVPRSALWLPGAWPPCSPAGHRFNPRSC